MHVQHKMNDVCGHAYPNKYLYNSRPGFGATSYVPFFGNHTIQNDKIDKNCMSQRIQMTADRADPSWDYMDKYCIQDNYKQSMDA